MNDKDYVTFARRFVKATAENMDVKELRDFYINALHEDIQEAYDDQGQRGHLMKWNHGTVRFLMRSNQNIMLFQGVFNM
tara:strand:- start:397 stop:633 length:237 start_codon:yes stop_codon:yes gene_type:complete